MALPVQVPRRFTHYTSGNKSWDFTVSRKGKEKERELSGWQGLTSVIMVRGVRREKDKKKNWLWCLKRVPVSLILSCAMTAIWHVFNVEGARNRKEGGLTLPCLPASQKIICLGIVPFPRSLRSDMVCHTVVEQLKDEAVRLSILRFCFIFSEYIFWGRQRNSFGLGRCGRSSSINLPSALARERSLLLHSSSSLGFPQHQQPNESHRPNSEHLYASPWVSKQLCCQRHF